MMRGRAEGIEGYREDMANVRSSLDVNEILANPNKKVTVNVEGKPVEMTNIESLHLFLEVLGQQMNQPPDFAQNLQYLLHKRAEYYDNLMLNEARDAYRRVNREPLSTAA